MLLCDYGIIMCGRVSGEDELDCGDCIVCRFLSSCLLRSVFLLVLTGAGRLIDYVPEVIICRWRLFL